MGIFSTRRIYYQFREINELLKDRAIKKKQNWIFQNKEQDGSTHYR